ncbi:thermonuclease family protein [Tropicimonas sp. S265A]|uniref:thermonuclease family protein n=1 Tax=Tropicimonas sp. S265A TaxID=3415134 RepID=UPI003C7CA541
MIPLVAFVLLLAAPQGDVYVADAGTLVMSGTAVRLDGIDLPHANSDQGAQAKRLVEDFVAGKMVTCRMQGSGLLSYWSGTCFADGEDIGQALVSAGLALDCPANSDGRYRRYEAPEARAHLKASATCQIEDLATGVPQ